MALFLCHGETTIDAEFLRFGIIARIPWSCRNTRWIPWAEMSSELRSRAITAEQLRLAMNGWI